MMFSTKTVLKVKWGLLLFLFYMTTNHSLPMDSNTEPVQQGPSEAGTNLPVEHSNTLWQSGLLSLPQVSHPPFLIPDVLQDHRLQMALTRSIAC
jgi:hypothetical protein